MRPIPPAGFTTALVVVLLTASGVCVALRRSADDRRASAFTAGAATRLERAGTTSGIARTHLGDRAELRQRLRSVLGTGDPLKRAETLVGWIDGMNPADFPVLFAEMRALCKSGDPAMHLVLAAWAEVDPAAALEQDLKWHVYEKSTVLKIWVERDPARALAWLVETGKHGSQVDLALETLVKADPAAALAWAKAHAGRLKGDRIAHPRMHAVLQAMLPAHMREVTEELSRLPEDMRLSLIPALSARVGQLTAEKRRQWLENFPPGDARDEAVAGVVSEMGGLEERLQLLAENPGAAGKVRSAKIYQQWVRSDRQAAMDSLGKLGPGPARNAAVNAVIFGLSDLGDPDTGVDLMNRYPEAVDLHTLLNWTSSTGNNAREWNLALTTLREVGNESVRESMYSFVLDNWMRRDLAGARSWLADHRDELPAAVRQAYEGR